jgi:outer membrane protein TolC
LRLALRATIGVLFAATAFPAAPAGAPDVVGWTKIGTLFQERFTAEAPGRVDVPLAELRKSRETQLKLDPKLDARLTRQSTDPASVSETYGVTQGSPFGTELGVSLSRSSAPDPTGGGSSERETQTLQLRQQLLKDGPWHGLAADEAAALRQDVALLKARMSYDDALLEALKALATAQQTAESLEASEKAVQRAEAQHKSVQELVNSGYRAKADLLVSEASLIRSQVNLEDARERAETARRKLMITLFLPPESPTPRIDRAKPPEAWLARLEALPWPSLPAASRLATLEADLAALAADLASRDDLPALSVAFGLSKTRDSLAGNAAELTRTVEVGLTAPIVTNIKRESAEIAALEATRAAAARSEADRAATARFAEASSERRLADQRLAAAEKLFALATRTLTIEQEKYSDGKSTIAEVRRVQEDVDRAQLTLIEASRDLLLSRVEWAHAAGKLAETLP